MPALLPPPIPRFSCSITRTSGNFSRTRSSVPSVEPWSTTTTSSPVTDSRHRSSHGSASYVTTTTVTSGRAIGDRLRTPAGNRLPEHDADAGKREQDRHHEEQESGRERLVVRHAELAEEADEERLAHADAVDRERHEHHEEQQRPEHDVREQPELDAHRAGRRVDRADAGQL